MLRNRWEAAVLRLGDGVWYDFESVQLRGNAPFPFTTSASDGFPVCGYPWRCEI